MHFSVLILTQHSDREAAVDHALGLMDAYDENLEFEHDRLASCPCQGMQAGRDALAAARELAKDLGLGEAQENLNLVKEEMLTLTGGEASPWQKPDSILDLIQDPEVRNRYAGQLDRLQGEIREIQERTDAHAKMVEESHPLAGCVDPACGCCQGSGYYFTRGNPEGRWDWWEIGGRWSGLLDADYDPAGDPQNFSDCKHCGGSGTRWWHPEGQGPEGEAQVQMLDGMKARALFGSSHAAGYPEYPGQEPPPGIEAKTCNGCQGVGVSRNFHNAPFQGDVCQVDEIHEAGALAASLSAVVDHDGVWHDAYGLDDQQWQAQIDTLLANHRQGTAILADCHC